MQRTAAPLPNGSQSLAYAVATTLHNAALFEPDAKKGCDRFVVDAAQKVVQRETLFVLRATLGREDWLSHVIRFVTQRALVERSSPLALSDTVDGALERLLQKLFDNRPPWSVASVRLPGTLLHLAAAHYDGCLFDRAAMAYRGGQGCVSRGITPRGYPLAVKSWLPGRCLETEPGAIASRDERAPRRFAIEARCVERGAPESFVDYADSHPSIHFLVTPLYAGSLEEHAPLLLQQPTPVPPSETKQSALLLPQARHWLRQLLVELRIVHVERRVVHQDIKPSNIFVCKQRRTLLFGDWGCAREMGPDSTAPRGGSTVDFAAPEQLQGEDDLTPAVDIFGLGATFIDLLVHQHAGVRNYRQHHFSTCTESLFRFTTSPPASPLWLRRQYSLFLRAREMPRNPRHLDPSMQRHFHSIFDSLSAHDPALTEVLERMVRWNAAERPTATEALGLLAQSSSAQADEWAALPVWAQIPFYRPADWQEVVRLRSWMRDIQQLFPRAA